MLKIIRLFNTLRHLKLIQWVGRFKNLIPKIIPSAKHKLAIRKINIKWNSPAWREQSLFKNRQVKFLNKKGVILNSKDWKNKSSKLIWLYNLHYFDDLNSYNHQERKKLQRIWLKRWIEDNPPCSGVGWNPYSTSLRIVNWVKWALKNNTLSKVESTSLLIQIRWLFKNLEIQFLSNHYWSNAKALCFASALFEGNEATKWRKKGIDILKSQLDEQCLRDGGHFERTPMYHSIFLEDILDLLNLCKIVPILFDDYLKNKLIIKADLMLRWLKAMTHPDNDISFFNDATLGIGPKTAVLIKYFEDVTESKFKYEISSSINLKESGFIRLENKNLVCLCDVGSIKPDFNPGHSHAETLSFELSFKEKRIIVNSGISLYGRSKIRQKQRSTFSHSTLEVDCLNSSDVWSGFRVGRRAKIINSKNDFKNNFVSASHDGYKFLNGNPIHSRMWCLEENQITIFDNVKSTESHLIKIIFIFHPYWEIEIFKNNVILIKERKSNKKIAFLIYERGLMPKKIKTTWNKEFGISIPNFALYLEGNNELSMKKTTICFDPIKLNKLIQTIKE